jgi:hypothetical protein
MEASEQQEREQPAVDSQQPAAADTQEAAAAQEPAVDSASPRASPEKTADAESKGDALAVGSRVWVKQRGFPWWPCMVTYDPSCGN